MEFELIHTLKRSFAQVRGQSVELSIGDDAAVLRINSRVVWTIDDSVEDVHFRLNWLSVEQASERAFHAAASDIAAMGAKPLAALCSVQLPAPATAVQLRGFRRGQLAASKATGCPIIGGNLTRGAAWRFTTTVLGSVTRPVTRAAARPGYELWLFGNVGMAACGRHWLTEQEKKRSPAKAAKDIAACVRAFVRPKALLQEGSTLDGRTQAAIDISDGLAADAEKLAAASGVKLILERALLEAALPGSLKVAAAQLGLDALSLALGGGEDYALLVAGPARQRPTGARCIGRVARGRGAWLEEAGRLAPLSQGFDHFAAR
jgi:thiamine-monophosphate kinase